ncbi:MAG: hypothetical protein BRC58_11520 [Cyanobacteria bacterium QS_8_64_29]|nr:MAG: hypothetical protein BRC58_11520 [Cyanobacteria bacterium QS_8_64_29]
MGVMLFGKRASAAQIGITNGSNGEAVKNVQAFLKSNGYLDGSVDGQYGDQTASAVREFQKARDLQVDGIVGPETWGAILSANR